MRTHARKDVLAALARAQKEKKPCIKEIFSDVFVEPTPELQEQRENLREILERYPDEYELGEFEGGKDGA